MKLVLLQFSDKEIACTFGGSPYEDINILSVYFAGLRNQYDESLGSVVQLRQYSSSDFIIAAHYSVDVIYRESFYVPDDLNLKLCKILGCLPYIHGLNRYNICYNAAVLGDLHLLRYAHKSGCPYNRSSLPVQTAPEIEDYIDLSM